MTAIFPEKVPSANCYYSTDMPCQCTRAWHSGVFP